MDPWLEKGAFGTIQVKLVVQPERLGCVTGEGAEPIAGGAVHTGAATSCFRALRLRRQAPVGPIQHFLVLVRGVSR